MNPATSLNDLSQGETLRERENTFQYFRSQREKYDIQILPGKTMSFLDYIMSLDLDPGLFNIVQRRKISVGENVYFIEFENKSSEADKTNLKWTIRRRFSDFLLLEKQLNEELIEGRKMIRTHVPQLHQFYNSRLDVAPEIFLQAAENYLRKLLDTPQIREKSVVLYEFLEMSLLPLPEGTQKLKEGYLKKKGGGRFKRNKLRLYCSMFFSNWQKRWFLLTEEGIIYTINSNSTKSREMILFDQSFQIEYGRKATGKKIGISLVSPNRRLNLQAKDVFEALDWVGEIKRAAKASPYTKINRFLSFAPAREATNNCKWYVDADGYYGDLHEALMNAKKEVFITDWWLTPELYLKKPAAEGVLENRLDQILGKIANNGVKVYVILYHEVKMVSYNDSEHAKRALQRLSSNITVLKHPSEPFFSWSHHEKLVVIDQTIGFIGGLDLCLGRSDTSDHPLVDPAEVEGTGETFPGQDYCNPRLADFKNVREQYGIPLVDKKAVPRMPFHDCHMKVIGPVVSDMCRHFIQYWNHVEIDCYGKEDEAPLPSVSMVPVKDEATLRKENATNKMRSAVRKIVGMRQLTGGFGTPVHHNDAVANKENVSPFEEETEPLASRKSYKRTQSTLPSIGGIPSIGSTGQLENPIKDEIQVILHDKKKALNQPEEIKEEDENNPSLNSSLDQALKNKLKMTYQNSGPAPAPKNNLLSEAGTETNIELRPKRVLPKLHGKIGSTVRETLEIEVNVLKENTKLPPRNLRIPNSRMVHTMQTIGQQPTRYLPGSQEEKDYNKRYADLLGNIRRKEQDYENELQLSHSKKVDTRNKNITKISPWEKKLLPKLSDQFYEKNMLQLLFRPKDKQEQGTCACQMLRSASKWSLGLNSNNGNVENSIQNAYIELIQNSKHFIYIENQFFMSGTAGKVVKNEVGQALVYRIEKAHARGEKFRVLIFMPLLPAFEGEIIDSKAALLRIQVHWQYRTICRGGESIYEQLRNKGIQPEDYIQFYSLRTHAKMPNGEPATEMIYIHSKVMVVDDDILLIGSANINDRSLQGSRDSEIAMVVEDSKKMTSFMDGEEVQVGEFACSIRRRLLAEHLGMTEDEVMDPLADEFTETLNEVAERNTQIYREIFYCYPDDTQKTIKDVDESAKKKDLSKYDELAPQIQGHVVWYPLEFLSEENLTAPINTMEYYIPDQTFV